MNFKQIMNFGVMNFKILKIKIINFRTKYLRKLIDFNRLLIFILVIFFLTIISLNTSASTITLQPSSWSATSFVSNPTNSFDNDQLTFTNLSTNSTIKSINISYYNFTTNENISEIKNITLSIIDYVNGSTPKNYSIFWFNTSLLLINSTTANQSRTTRNYSLPISSWDDIRNIVKLNFSIYGNNTILKIYDIKLLIVIDDQSPIINLSYPKNNYIQNNSYINLSFLADDDTGLTNCSLFLNNGLNKTNNSVKLNAPTNFSLSLSDGTYDWYIRCYDNSTAHYYSDSETRTFSIDLLPPNITLISPDNNSIISGSSDIPTKLLFNFSDVSQNVTCNLFINDSINQSSMAWPNIDQYFLVYFDNGNYSWQINCTDFFNRTGISKKKNFLIQNNLPPSIQNVKITKNISLTLGSSTIVWCNSTIIDSSSSEVSSVSATLRKTGYIGPAIQDYKYINNSCEVLPNNGTSKLSYCSFHVTSYAKAGSWICELNATDTGSLIGYGSNITFVDPFYAINITPDFLNYGSWKPGETTSAVPLTISNIGNSFIDITLDGFGNFNGDGLAMTCDLGNITLSNHRYSFSSLTSFDSMTSLTDYPILLSSFDLAPSNSTVDSNKSIYWKIRLSSPLKGNCTGYVVITAVPD